MLVEDDIREKILRHKMQMSPIVVLKMITCHKTRYFSVHYSEKFIIFRPAEINDELWDFVNVSVE